MVCFPYIEAMSMQELSQSQCNYQLVTFRQGKALAFCQNIYIFLDSDTYCFVHFILQIRLGAEDLICARRAKRLYDLCQQEEVIEQKAIQFLVALGLVEFPTVQKFAWPQAVCNRIKNKLLGGEGKTHTHT